MKLLDNKNLIFICYSNTCQLLQFYSYFCKIEVPNPYIFFCIIYGRTIQRKDPEFFRGNY